MKNVALHNLGCKVNSYEMEVMQQMLQEKGYNIVPFDQAADIYVVNTCTVTNIADRKSRQMLHRAKAKNPDAVVVAVGCYVQTGREKVEADECIDLAIGNNRKKDLVAILEDYLSDREDKVPGSTAVIEEDRTCEYFEYEEMTLKQTGSHTRAYIKIQDGCNQFCSYCIIPYARGRVRSRPAADILKEIQGIVAAGCQEIVLTGIHISSYGVDMPDRPKLIELIELIHEIQGLRRLRLGSLEPRIITAENAARLSRLNKLCPHFHLSLQSGCDETLKRMNRHYTTREYYQSVEILRETFHHPAITTDVIVGFPGETEEEFRETCRFLEQVNYYEMHVFKYSRRQGTRAAEMQDQVQETIKTSRSNELLSLGKRCSREFREYYIGRKTEVLFETHSREYQIGYTADYVKVALKTEENLSNCLKKVEITGFLTDDILNSTSLH